MNSGWACFASSMRDGVRSQNRMSDWFQLSKDCQLPGFFFVIFSFRISRYGELVEGMKWVRRQAPSGDRHTITALADNRCTKFHMDPLLRSGTQSILLVYYTRYVLRCIREILTIMAQEVHKKYAKRFLLERVIEERLWTTGRVPL